MEEQAVVRHRDEVIEPTIEYVVRIAQGSECPETDSHEEVGLWPNTMPAHAD